MYVYVCLSRGQKVFTYISKTEKNVERKKNSSKGVSIDKEY